MASTNWEPGHRGWKSTLSRAQRQELMLFWSQHDWKLPAARRMLKEQYGVEVNGRTLGRYKNDLKGRWDRRNSGKAVIDKPVMDKPVDWANFAALANSSVPNQHLRELRQVSETIERAVRVQSGSYIRPTYRTLRWRGYVIEYYGEAVKKPQDQTYVAALYSFREIAHEYFNVPMTRDDLDQWLGYQPWQGTENEAAYLYDINEGVINALDLGSGLEDVHSWTEPKSAKVVDENFMLGMNVLTMVRLIQDSPYPNYFLPSLVNLDEVRRWWQERVTRMVEKRDDNSVVYLGEPDFSWYQKSILGKFPELRQERQ